MSRLNSWKIAVVVSSSIGLIASAYSALTGVAFRSAIEGWVSAMNANDYNAIDLFADKIGTTEAPFNDSAWPVLATAILFAIAIIGWTHANAKLAAEIDGDSLSHTTGWAVGAWFVPFLNLVRPRKILAESLDVRGHKSLIGLLNVWWAFFLLDTLVSRASASALSSAEDALASVGDSAEEVVSAFNGLSSAIATDVFTSLFSMPAYVLAIILVLRASKQGEVAIANEQLEELVSVSSSHATLMDSGVTPAVTAVLENEFKKCQFCAEEIRAEAVKCKHCGSDIS